MKDARARKEAVKPEREEGALFLGIATTLPIAPAGEEKKVAQGTAAAFMRLARLLVQHGGCTVEVDRTSSLWIAGLALVESETGLDPSRHGVGRHFHVGHEARRFPANHVHQNLARYRTWQFGPPPERFDEHVLRGISVAKSIDATFETVRRRSMASPLLDIVADVPMQIRPSSLTRRSRTRRTSMATSAP